MTLLRVFWTECGHQDLGHPIAALESCAPPNYPRTHHPRHFHYSLFCLRTGRISRKLGADVAIGSRSRAGARTFRFETPALLVGGKKVVCGCMKLPIVPLVLRAVLCCHPEGAFSALSKMRMSCFLVAIIQKLILEE